jgi:hypothetical protein
MKIPNRDLRKEDLIAIKKNYEMTKEKTKWQKKIKQWKTGLRNL